jgi:hypothetical protein
MKKQEGASKKSLPGVKKELSLNSSNKNQKSMKSLATLPQGAKSQSP